MGAAGSNERPAVSICIPLYNGVEYLEQCLDSVRAQTFTDIEIILVDDCSSDATYEVAKRFTFGDPRIRLVRNDRNLGLVGNWNRCIELAQGEWIKFVFQDDWIFPRCLELLVRAASSATVLIACARTLVFEEGTSDEVRSLYLNHQLTLKTLFATGAYISPEQMQLFALQHPEVNPLGEPTAVMFRKSVVDEFGLFNAAFVSLCDLEYWMRVAIHRGAAIVPEELAVFRVHGAATSANNLSRRSYRTTFLDRLVLLHEYVYAPCFLPLRRRAEQMSIDLKQLLNDRVHRARATALWAAQPPSNDRSLLAELNDVAQTYPRLNPSPVPHYLWRIRRRVFNYFMGARAP